LSEDALQEASRPTFREVRPSKISVRQNETVFMFPDAPVQMHQPRETIAWWECRSAIDFQEAVSGFVSGGGNKMIVKIGSNKAHFLFAVKELQ
jgi:hypothetical protein